MLRISIPFVALALAFTTTLYLISTRPTVSLLPPQERVWPVRAVTAQAESVRPLIIAFGEVVARRDLELRPLVAGTVARVGDNLRNGGVAATGELLVEIDPFDYQAAIDEASAQLAEAEARLSELQAQLHAAENIALTDRGQLVLRQRDLDRSMALVRNGTASQATLDKTVLALNQERRSLLETEREIVTLGARLAQQNATIDRLKVGLRRAERELAETKLTAPFGGFLTDVDVATGKRLGIGDRVARLIDAGALEVRFHLSDTQYARLVASGTIEQREVTVLWRIGEVERSFDAKLVRSEGRFDPASGGVALYAAIKGIDTSTLLRPGAFVRIEIPDRVYQSVFALPRAAIKDEEVVYVVGADGRLQPRDVTITLRDSDTILVGGALDGEQVVTTDFPEIGPGLLVEVAE